MFKKKGIWYLSLCGLLLWGGITILPRAIEKQGAQAGGADTEQASDLASSSALHALEMSPRTILQIAHGRARFLEQQTDSLAWAMVNTYLDYYLLDSAWMYLEWLTEQPATLAGLRVFHRGISLYAATELTSRDPLLVEQLRSKGNTYAADLVNSNLSQQEQTEVEIIQALWETTTNNPMAGIQRIQAVLRADPENEIALLAMGKLSFQSGQDKKAVNYMEKLLHISPKHVEGLLYLGNYYVTSARQAEKGRELLEKARNISSNPAIQQLVEQYLNTRKTS